MRSIAAPVAARDFINRERERREFSRVWTAVNAGSGSLIVLEGEAGVGKSRLLAEFRATAAAAGGWTAAGLCLPYAPAPYGPVSDVLQRIAVQHPGAFPPAPHLRGMLRSLVPGIAAPFDTSPASSDISERWLRDGIFETLRRLSARTPAFIALEDIHWADNGTLGLLARIAPVIADLRIAVVVTVRSEDVREPVAALLAGSSNELAFYRFMLSELTLEDSRKLAVAALPAGSEAPPEIIARICATGGGHPLFIEELVKHSIERTSQGDMPTSIERALQSRLVKFDAPALRILEIAAAVGTEFSVGELAEIGGAAPEAVLAVLDGARDRNFLAELPARPQVFRFRHELMRQAVYANAFVPTMRDAHMRIAARLESTGEAAPAKLAHHYFEAGDLPSAARYAERAGDEAFADATSFLDAAGRYELALSLTAQTDAVRLHFKLGRTYARLGNLDRAMREYEQAKAGAEGSGDREIRLLTLWEMIPALLRLARRGEALARSQEGLALAATSPDPRERIMGHAYCAQSLAGERRIAEAAAHLDTVEPIDESLPGIAVPFYHAMRAEVAFLSGDAARWRAAAAAAILEAGTRRFVDLQWSMLHNACGYFLEIGEFAPAEHHMEESLAVAVRFGLHRAARISRVGLAEARMYRGRFEEAKTLLLEAAREPANEVDRVFLSAVAMQLAEATADAALRDAFAAEPLLEVARGTGDPEYFGPLAAAHALEHTRRGDKAEARKLFEEAAAMMTDARQNLQTLLWVAMCGFACDMPQARTLLVEEGALRPGARQRFCVLAYDAFAAHHAGRKGGARRLGAAAAAEARNMESPLLERYASAAGNDRLPWEATAAPSTTALSARQSASARLAASGKTNREIADALQISERTAEQHVAAALRKLGARSRTELAARFREL